MMNVALNTTTLTLKARDDIEKCTPLQQLSLFGNGRANWSFLDKAAVHVNNNMWMKAWILRLVV
jgi:hypothetical protein